jgi:hypothetical protein
MARFLVSAVAAAVCFTLVAPAPASGVTYDKQAFLTFNAPVQIPGATLNAGTYRFHLTNESTGRSVLQVLSHDGAIVYSMFLTRPDSRTAVTADPTVTFLETPVGVPPALRSLFYAWEYRGYEFVYPTGEPNMVPEVVPQPPIRYMAAMPAGEVVMEPEVVTLAPPPIFEEAELEAFAEPQPAELPRTATPLPLVAVGGLGALLTGLGLGRLRRRDG